MLAKSFTKIIATIGPATANKDVLKNLLLKGVSIIRLNFSHGDHQFHLNNINLVREISNELGLYVGILQDLSGPKIRIGKIKKPLVVHQGDFIEFYFDKVECRKEGNRVILCIDYPEVLKILKKGDLVFIADGSIKTQVIEKTSEKVITKVILGGILSSRKGVNFPGIKLPISSLTEKDKKDLAFGIKHGVDFISLSFVNTKEDVIECKELIKSLGGDQLLFAKIETQSAVENIDEILKVADGIMVARGDLGVEVPIEKVPIIQKQIIKKTRALGKPVIVATQMLTSMINSLMPTRADVSDIANAVLDEADCLMLSDETTIGKYPLEAVETMQKTIAEAEKIYPFLSSNYTIKTKDEAIAHSCAILAKEIGATKIVVFTKSGISAIRVAKFRPNVPILAVCHDVKVMRKLSVFWGIIPALLLPELKNPETILKCFLEEALKKNLINKKDVLVITIGSQVGKTGSTNIIRYLKVEEEIATFYSSTNS